MKAIVQMEEKYADLNITYNTSEEKESIFKSNEEAVKIFGISPHIYFKPVRPGTGRVSLEFSINSREIGEYFEYIISDLNLDIK